MIARTYGKWILAGEHAVLRGCPALVFPLLSKRFELFYSDDGGRLRATFSGEHGPELQPLFWLVIERALALKNLARDDVRGRLDVVSQLPIGAGLGASAALCVAVGRWFIAMGWARADELDEFARGLEDLFHGESSGVDVAVAISGRGLRFVRGGPPSDVARAWSPNWCLSYSGQRSVTSECVARVKALFRADRARAQSLDEQMRRSVAEAEAAFLLTDSEGGFARMGGAVDLACETFADWGLAGGAMGEHLVRLRAGGAAAVKPTGSGAGGFALSLWREPPSAETIDRLGLISTGAAHGS